MFHMYCVFICGNLLRCNCFFSCYFAVIIVYILLLCVGDRKLAVTDLFGSNCCLVRVLFVISWSQLLSGVYPLLDK